MIDVSHPAFNVTGPSRTSQIPIAGWHLLPVGDASSNWFPDIRTSSAKMSEDRRQDISTQVFTESFSKESLKQAEQASNEKPGYS